jgi:DNA-binding CsgD family transcriptional regulator
MMNSNNPGDKPDDNSRDSKNPPSNNQNNHSGNRDKSKKEWNFAAELRRFLRENNWEKTGIDTNQLEFSQLFSDDLDRLVLEHKEIGKTTFANLIQALHDQIITLCSHIDPVTHKGCATKHEKITLLKNLAEAKTKIEELADIIEMLWAKFKAAERLQSESQRQCPIKVTGIDAPQSSTPKADDRTQVPAGAREKRRTRTASSELSEREKQIWAAVQVQGKTIAQAAIQFDCTTQNISKHLNNADRKLKAQQSRSADTSYRLPEDNRGQVRIEEENM